MNIQGISHVHGAHNLRGPQSTRGTQETSAPPKLRVVSDQLDISPAAMKASEAGDVRQDLVARVKAEIANGSYETPEKIDAALDKFLDQLI